MHDEDKIKWIMLIVSLMQGLVILYFLLCR